FLAWLGPSRSPDRRLYWLYAPLWIGIVFWFFASPDRRFLGSIPELTGGLAGFLAIRQFADSGRSGGVTAMLTWRLPTVWGPLAVGVAGLIAVMSGPLAWHG